VESAQAALASAKQQRSVLSANIEEAAAAVAQAQADLQTARLNLSYAQIRSPIDGYVGNRAAQFGAYVSQGTYLLTIVPAHGLWVDANFKEDQLARMQAGQPAMIVADTGETLAGRLLLRLVRDAVRERDLSLALAEPYMQLAIYDLFGALFVTSELTPISSHAEKLFRRVCGVIKTIFPILTSVPARWPPRRGSHAEHRRRPRKVEQQAVVEGQEGNDVWRGHWQE
jgi:hypothetical protein